MERYTGDKFFCGDPERLFAFPEWLWVAYVFGYEEDYGWVAKQLARYVEAKPDGKCEYEEVILKHHMHPQIFGDSRNCC